jgi:hypothetical protein
MRYALLIDFGSTFTKVTAVDLISEEIVGTASAFTTVDSDIGTGLNVALDRLRRVTGDIIRQHTGKLTAKFLNRVPQNRYIKFTHRHLSPLSELMCIHNTPDCAIMQLFAVEKPRSIS